jgi:VIT family protein
MTAHDRPGATITDAVARPGPFGWPRALVADRGSLRSWTQVANDGIIATAGILEGFAGAGASDRTLITAATTATIVGTLSVGGAEWAEAAAERDGQLAAADEEAAEIAHQPDVEHAEVAAYYEAKGLTPQLAREVADQLMARDAVDAQLESEHGILEIMSPAERREFIDPCRGLGLADRNVDYWGAHRPHEPAARPRPRAHRRSRNDGRQLPCRKPHLLRSGGLERAAGSIRSGHVRGHPRSDPNPSDLRSTKG